MLQLSWIQWVLASVNMLYLILYINVDYFIYLFDIGTIVFFLSPSHLKHLFLFINLTLDRAYSKYIVLNASI